MTEPVAGDIWRYPYLWVWQSERGETEGRKPRPTVLAAVVPVQTDVTHLYFLPLTATPPDEGREHLEVPAIELRRAGLTDYKRVWVILDEHNRDTLEQSLYFEPGAKVGTFSKAQTKLIAARFLAAYRARRGAGGVDRTD